MIVFVTGNRRARIEKTKPSKRTSRASNNERRT